MPKTRYREKGGKLFPCVNPREKGQRRVKYVIVRKTIDGSHGVVA